METNRRDLVKMMALTLASSPIANAQMQPDTSAYGAALRARQAQVKTLRVRYTHIGDARDSLNGINEVQFNGRAYHFRHFGLARPFQILTSPRECLMAFGEPSQIRIMRRSVPKRWPPAPSVDNFLPAPSMLPLAAIEPKAVDGRPCVGLAQGEFCFWIDPANAQVHCRETLSPKGQVRLVEQFSDFRPSGGYVEFPHRIGIEIYGRDGLMVRAAQILVNEVDVNGELDPFLFDFSRYRSQ